MANVLFVLAPKGFRDKEYFAPYKILEEDSHCIQTASTIVGELTGADGGEASSSLHISEVNPREFEAVIFVGGPGMSELVDDAEMTRLATSFFKENKLVAAICIAPAILAKAELIKDKKITGWIGIEEDVTSAGAQLTGNPVEIDQNIITASGPDAAEEFARQISSYLEGKQ